MQVLILSGNTGGGHNSAAMAVKDFFTAKGCNCEIRDSIAFWGSLQSDIISNGHIFIYKNTPKLFGVGYRFAENHPAKQNYTSFLYKTFSKGAKNLYEHLIDKNYNTIICTHVFSGIIATEVKRRYMPQLKIYFVATDYTCSPGVPEIDAVKYFIPHKLLTEEFTQAKIEQEKLCPSGIPLRARFYENTDKETAKKELGLPQNKHIALLMCGSMGCGPIKELAGRISALLPENGHLAIICGSNKSLQKELNSEINRPNVTIVGYTDRMDLYMDAATVAITKPGGLSSTEALTKGVPIVLIDAVPGCETRNIEFLVGNGFAVTADTTVDLTSKVLSYITNEKLQQETSKNLLSEFGINSAEKIYNEVIKTRK